MWFRSLRIYRIASDWGKDSNPLNDLLAAHPLTPCGSLAMQSSGWVHPKPGNFVHAVNKQWLIALCVEQRLLPASVIRQVTQERVAQIEAEQARTLGRKEVRDLRENITLELLPRAFTHRRTTSAWIDPIHGWLVLDAGSDSKADEFMDALLKAVEGIQVRPLQTKLSPSSAMTEWVAAGESPPGFSIDDDLELRAIAAEKSVIRYVHHALEGEEIQRHIANGKVATRLGMTWNDRISFLLNDKMQIKRLSFLDILKETNEQSSKDADEQFDLDFVLMAGELDKLFSDLLAALGGEVETI